MKMLFAALAVLCSMSAAHATDVLQVEDGNAITNCKGPLPFYDTVLRQRPLAIVNESTRPVFVNCSYRAPVNSYGQNMFGVMLHNYSNEPVNVHCTFIIGVDDGNATYHPVDTAVGPGQRILAAYSTGDTGGVRWGNSHANDKRENSSVQCNLPPSVGINETPQSFQQK